MGAKIKGLGHTIPKKKIPNQFFIDQGLDTSDEWLYLIHI